MPIAMGNRSRTPASSLKVKLQFPPLESVPVTEPMNSAGALGSGLLLDSLPLSPDFSAASVNSGQGRRPTLITAVPRQDKKEDFNSRSAA